MRRILVLALLFAAILLGTPLAGQAQTPAAPAGTVLNPYKIIIGPLPGQVAGGDALASTTTVASGAATAAATAQTQAAAAQTAANSASTTASQALSTAAAAVPTTSLPWDGQALAYAVPNGPRVCVVISAACPGLLPRATATMPANAITAATGQYVFDPVTGLYITAN